MIILNLLLNLGIAYLCFCRIVKMDKYTSALVRYSFSGFGTSAFALAIAPYFWGLKVHPSILAFSACQLAVLLSMSRIWRHGTPLEVSKRSK